MNKQTIANAIFTRAYELKDTDLTTEDCQEPAEAVIAAMKRELPRDWAAMLTASTECILTRGGFNRYDYPDVYNPEHSRYIAATKEAAAILEAAGVAAVLETEKEWGRQLNIRCAELLARIGELEAEIAEARKHTSYQAYKGAAERIEDLKAVIANVARGGASE